MFKRNLLWKLVQQVRLNFQVSFFSRRVVEHVYCGEKLRVSIEDGLGKAWYDKDWPNLREFELLGTGRLVPGALVFDIGSHQGVVAMILARKVSPTGKVVCAEPSPHNFKVLLNNARLNGLGNIEAEQVAVGDSVGKLTFNSSLNGSASAVTSYGLRITVDQVTINSLVAKYGPPQVVVLDIEGFEERALSAGADAFNSNCDFMVEVHVGAGLESAGGSVAGVLAYFPADQFDRYVHHDDGKEPIRLETASPQFFEKRFFLTALGKR